MQKLFFMGLQDIMSGMRRFVRQSNWLYFFEMAAKRTVQRTKANDVQLISSQKLTFPVRPFLFYPSILPSVYPLIRPSICLSVRPSIRLYLYRYQYLPMILRFARFLHQECGGKHNDCADGKQFFTLYSSITNIFYLYFIFHRITVTGDKKVITNCSPLR